MITPLTFSGDDAAMVEALQAGHAGAAAAFYDRYAKRVRAMLLAAIGPDQDLSDLIHDVFIVAFNRIGTLRDVDNLSRWLAAIAVFVGRAHVRRRSRRGWLRLFSPDQTRVQQDEQPPSDTRQALREVYAILDRMPVEPRMAFLLRYAHGMTVSDAASACGTSVSTFKRRLDRATKDFLQVARTRPSLLQCLRDGTRWNQETQT
jgi:RNA polymerase sigma-70 factor (ECF subfamily)